MSMLISSNWNLSTPQLPVKLPKVGGKPGRRAARGCEGEGVHATQSWYAASHVHDTAHVSCPRQQTPGERTQ